MAATIVDKEPEVGKLTDIVCSFAPRVRIRARARRISSQGHVLFRCSEIAREYYILLRTRRYYHNFGSLSVLPMPEQKALEKEQLIMKGEAKYHKFWYTCGLNGASRFLDALVRKYGEPKKTEPVPAREVPSALQEEAEDEEEEEADEKETSSDIAFIDSGSSSSSSSSDDDDSSSVDTTKSTEKRAKSPEVDIAIRLLDAAGKTKKRPREKGENVDLSDCSQADLEAVYVILHKGPIPTQLTRDEVLQGIRGLLTERKTKRARTATIQAKLNTLTPEETAFLGPEFAAVLQKLRGE